MACALAACLASAGHASRSCQGVQPAVEKCSSVSVEGCAAAAAAEVRTHQEWQRATGVGQQQLQVWNLIKEARADEASDLLQRSIEGEGSAWGEPV